MAITEDQRQFIIKTLLPYKENRKTCSTARGTGIKRCAYIGKNGRKCAVGQHMKQGEWQQFKGNFYGLIEKYDQNDFFTEEALKQSFNPYIWTMIQMYHDNRALGEPIDTPLYNLESETGVEFPELKL